MSGATFFTTSAEAIWSKQTIKMNKLVHTFVRLGICIIIPIVIARIIQREPENRKFVGTCYIALHGPFTEA
jgi:hypothetical protein